MSVAVQPGVITHVEIRLSGGEYQVMIVKREVIVSTLMLNASRVDTINAAQQNVYNHYKKRGYHFPDKPPELVWEELSVSDPRVSILHWICGVAREQISLV